MPLPTFNLQQRQQLRNDAREQDLIERAQAHITKLREGAERNEARLAQYETGGVREVMDFITKSLAAPANHREWKKIIDHGKTVGHDGLTREPLYREFQDETHRHLLSLGSDYGNIRENISDALRPENMSHYLADRISATDPNPRETLQSLIAHHIRPADKAALEDVEHAQGYARHLARENDGQVLRGP